MESTASLQNELAKSNRKVSRLSPNLYPLWRAEQARAAALRDDDRDAPPERLLQAVWLNQRITREHLKTSDGRPVRVLHPGIWNHEAGPDFRDAVLQFGSNALCVGDVEIDLEPGCWRSHGHEGNPAYAKVLLHVVWDGTGKSALPTLALKAFLDAPLAELAHWLGSETGKKLPGALAGQCAAPLKDLPAETLAELLQQAAQVRLQGKAAQIEARARQAGWEQALWEGLCAALGYKHNVWPMRRLAELLPHLTAREKVPCESAFPLQARLLGVSGLLPAELSRKEAGADSHLRRIWDAWWRERDRFSDMILPRAAWRFNGLRPANHPQRRLALVAHWRTDASFVKRLEQWFTVSDAAPTPADSLLKVLQVADDDFWSWHWTFRSARLVKSQPLLGAARVTDLAVNVLLPWFWARAVAGLNEPMRAIAEARYHAWPAAEDNSLLKLARERLLATASPRTLRTAAQQQGLLQIVRDFCGQSDALCTGCRFPELVRSIGK